MDKADKAQPGNLHTVAGIIKKITGILKENEIDTGGNYEPDNR